MSPLHSCVRLIYFRFCHRQLIHGKSRSLQFIQTMWEKLTTGKALIRNFHRKLSTWKALTRKLTFHRPRCLQGPSAAASADRCPVKTHKLISAHQHHPWIIFVWHNLSILDLVHVGSCGMLPLWKEELLPSSGSLRPEPSSEKRWKQILSSIFHPFITDETGKEISPFWWRWHKGIQPSLPSQCSPWGRHSSPVTFVNVNPHFEFSFLILSRWWQLMSNRWHWTNQWVATVKEQKVSYCGEALRWIGRALDQVDIGPSLKKFMRQRQLLECECTVTRLSDMSGGRVDLNIGLCTPCTRERNLCGRGNCWNVTRRGGEMMPKARASFGSEISATALIHGAPMLRTVQ